MVKANSVSEEGLRSEGSGERPDFKNWPDLLDARVSPYARDQPQHGARTMLSPDAKQAVATELKKSPVI